MSKTSHIAFFGDAAHRFDLAAPNLVRELEAATNAGIGALIARVIHERTFRHADLEHTIRLGLIGGGMSPKDAARLVAAYLPLAPLEEGMILAMSILGALFVGNNGEEELPVEEAPAPEEAPVPELPAVEEEEEPPAPPEKPKAQAVPVNIIDHLAEMAARNERAIAENDIFAPGRRR